MPKSDYMKLKLSLAEARAEANLLRIQMHQYGCTLKEMIIRPFWTDFANFYQTSNTKKIQKKERKQARQPPT